MAGSKTTRTRARSSGTGAKAGGAKGAGPRTGGNAGQSRPAQASRPGTRPARAAAAAAAPVPEVSPGPPGWLRWTSLVLAVAGLGVSVYLTIAHYTTAVALACPNTGAINCEKVTTSPESNVFGIPVAVLGLAFYLFLVPIMSPWAWRSGRRDVALARLLSLVVGIGFVLYLVYAEVFEIGNICLWCTSVHVITLVLFALIAISAAIWGLGPAAASAASRAARRR
ncbi:MAG TPA: vitamin K epoxide reductase family protein [Streptosporangiaceae bacterium]